MWMLTAESLFNWCGLKYLLLVPFGSPVFYDKLKITGTIAWKMLPCRSQPHNLNANQFTCAACSVRVHINTFTVGCSPLRAMSIQRTHLQFQFCFRPPRVFLFALAMTARWVCFFVCIPCRGAADGHDHGDDKRKEETKTSHDASHCCVNSESYDHLWIDSRQFAQMHACLVCPLELMRPAEHRNNFKPTKE